MKKYTAIFLTAALIISIVSVVGLAQQYGLGSGAGVPGAGKSFRGEARGGMNAGQDVIRGLMRLDLTDSQREQIKLILDEHRELMQDDCDLTSEEMKSIKDELDALNNSEVFNEDAVRQALYRKFEINTEKQILRQKVHHQILWEVLDADQRDALAEQRANAEAFGRGSRGGRQGGNSRGMGGGIF
jgi:Spy/CpxP family protein refolding chaperone